MPLNQGLLVQAQLGPPSPALAFAKEGFFKLAKYFASWEMTVFCILFNYNFLAELIIP